MVGLVKRERVRGGRMLELPCFKIILSNILEVLQLSMRYKGTNSVVHY